MIEGKVHRDHIATVGDLILLREELLSEIAKLLRNEAIGKPVQWLKSAQVSKMLGISFGTLHSLRIKGILRFSKVGRIILYNSQDIEKLLSDNTRG
ncbi:helix-turn-helix domain-containing protein [Dawidia soli]|uniref:helix-turn-helix domain-containing protein n=1 Tax=Dawidia soli TaxID=2782352 RepID=UPI003742DFC3